MFPSVNDDSCSAPPHVPVGGDGLAVDDRDVALGHAALVLGHARVAARPGGAHVLDRQIEPPPMMTAAPEDSSVGQDGFAAFVDVRGIVVLPDVDGVVLVAPEHALICVGYIILFAFIVLGNNSIGHFYLRQLSCNAGLVVVRFIF